MTRRCLHASSEWVKLAWPFSAEEDKHPAASVQNKLRSVFFSPRTTKFLQQFLVLTKQSQRKKTLDVND